MATSQADSQAAQRLISPIIPILPFFETQLSFQARFGANRLRRSVLRRVKPSTQKLLPDTPLSISGFHVWVSRYQVKFLSAHGRQMWPNDQWILGRPFQR